MYYNWEKNTSNEELNVVCNLIKNGELVIFPTETVYGIGANALDSKAVGKIFLAKGRPSDNPLIVHIAKKDTITKIAKDITETEQKLMYQVQLTLQKIYNGQAPETVQKALFDTDIYKPKKQASPYDGY